MKTLIVGLPGPAPARFHFQPLGVEVVAAADADELGRLMESDLPAVAVPPSFPLGFPSAAEAAASLRARAAVLGWSVAWASGDGEGWSERAGFCLLAADRVIPVL